MANSANRVDYLCYRLSYRVYLHVYEFLKSFCAYSTKLFIGINFCHATFVRLRHICVTELSPLIYEGFCTL